MQQSKRRKVSDQSNHFITAWKGKVKQFKIEKGRKMALVQHVFMHKELHIPPNVDLPRHRPNCKSCYIPVYVTLSIIIMIFT